MVVGRKVCDEGKRIRAYGTVTRYGEVAFGKLDRVWGYAYGLS